MKNLFLFKGKPLKIRLLTQIRIINNHNKQPVIIEYPNIRYDVITKILFESAYQNITIVEEIN